MSEEVVGKYIGPRAVQAVVTDEMKTFGGNEVVVVHYEGGKRELMPARTFELLSSDNPSDLTTVRGKKYDELRRLLYPIVGEYISHLGDSEDDRKERKTEMLKKVLSTISEIDMTDEEMEPFFNQVSVEFNGVVNAILYELSNAMGRAVSLLWNKDDSIFVPGTNPIAGATFLESIKIVNDNTKSK